MSPTVVYTDGACSGNPGPGGWAWAVPDGPFAAGAAEQTTNQRMEIQAVLEALRALDGQVEVVSDSTYVVHCFRDRWWEGWLRRGWVNSAKKPVANRDLWEPLIELVRSRGDVTFRWVKGHSGDAMNDLVDALAVEAAQRQQSRSGDRPPSTAPVVDAGPSPSSDGHRILVTGLKPEALGGHRANPTAESVRRKLAEVLRAKGELHPDARVVSGLALGGEMLGAEAARDAGLALVAVVPFPEYDRRWPEETRTRYADLVAGAADTVRLEKKAPDSAQKFGGAMRRRDAWLARHVEEAVVVWDHDDPHVGRFVRSLVDQLGEENVWVVDPTEL